MPGARTPVYCPLACGGEGRQRDVREKSCAGQPRARASHGSAALIADAATTGKINNGRRWRLCPPMTNAMTTISSTHAMPHQRVLSDRVKAAIKTALAMVLAYGVAPSM